MNKEALQARIDRLRGRGLVEVVTVANDQFYPTPPDLAARMVDLAEIPKGSTVLEPSAGSGNLLQAVFNNSNPKAVVAVEIDPQLAARLEDEYPLTFIHCRDFLGYERPARSTDRVIMNPPFKNGEDIKHVKHALEFLKPGGRLVALCAGGPRQEAQLRPLADYWERLPEGTFKGVGTVVSCCLLVINKEA